MKEAAGKNLRRLPDWNPFSTQGKRKKASFRSSRFLPSRPAARSIKCHRHRESRKEHETRLPFGCAAPGCGIYRSHVHIYCPALSDGMRNPGHHVSRVRRVFQHKCRESCRMVYRRRYSALVWNGEERSCRYPMTMIPALNFYGPLSFPSLMWRIRDELSWKYSRR